MNQLIRIQLFIFISLSVTGDSNVTIMVLSWNDSKFLSIEFVISSKINLFPSFLPCTTNFHLLSSISETIRKSAIAFIIYVIINETYQIREMKLFYN